MTFLNKILPLDQLSSWRNAQRQAGRRVVVTNGCFDLLHVGHVTCLEAARKQGDLLLIGLNSDASIRGLKGPERPINNEQDRAAVVAALESVSAVCIYPEVSAARFLSLAEPDVYVKGGDYTLETLNQEERQIVESRGGKIVLIPMVPGRSTTAVIGKLSRGNG